MITIHIKDVDYISQRMYDDVIAGLDLHELICTCGNCQCLIHHGSYERKIKASDREFRLRVNRVKCIACGRTHALLPSSIIPYSQIVLKEQLNIINFFENKPGYGQFFQSDFFLDENAVRAVILRYRRNWKQGILAYQIAMYLSELLIKQCFNIFQRQFMQIRKIPNILFLIPT